MLSDGDYDLPSGGRVRVERGRPVELWFLDTEDVPADLVELVREAEALSGVQLAPIDPSAIRAADGRREFTATLSLR
jgi:hypothetical protein